MLHFFVLFIVLFFSSNYCLQAQKMNYAKADSLFAIFTKNSNFLPDSIPTLSIAPKEFIAYIQTIEQRQLHILDSFAKQYPVAEMEKEQLKAKICYKNFSHLLQHPIQNGFFAVQQDEDVAEEIKSFYRRSYQDYSSFLDTIEISQEQYLVVPEYIEFLNNYLNYQEIRFHIFNGIEKCNAIDRYWLLRLLFTGKVRKIMAEKIYQELQKTYSSQELMFVRKDFEQKYKK